MTKEEIERAVNTISNLIVNSQEVHDLVHKQVCSELGLNPDEDLSAQMESNDAFESKYYHTGARYWSALTIRAAAQLDPLNK